MTAPTPRRPMSPKRRHAIFSENCTAHNVAPCCICGEPVHRHIDQWIIEHKRALGLLGPDVNTNCGPAHTACALKKTAEQDLPRIAKAKRQAEAAKPRYVHDTRTPQGVAIMAIPDAKKPARGFQAPAGRRYDWRLRRYVLILQSPA